MAIEITTLYYDSEQKTPQNAEHTKVHAEGHIWFHSCQPRNQESEATVDTEHRLKKHLFRLVKRRSVVLGPVALNNHCNGSLVKRMVVIC